MVWSNCFRAKGKPACCVTDVQMHHILLIQKQRAEVHTARGQHRFVGLEVNPVNYECAVTQQALLTLPVQLLQDLPAVPRELHPPEGTRVGPAGKHRICVLKNNKLFLVPFNGSTNDSE